jgi:hypothetical protein
MTASEKQRQKSLQEANKFIASFRKARKGALQGVEEMLKHPVSLEQAREQTYRIQASTSH